MLQPQPWTHNQGWGEAINKHVENKLKQEKHLKTLWEPQREILLKLIG